MSFLFSLCKAMKKGEFKEKIYEVTTLGNYLTADTKIRIVSLKNNKIITISDHTINPENFDVAEEVKVRVYKDNSIGFTHSKPYGF